MDLTTRILAAMQGKAMTNFNRRDTWESRRDAALNRAIVDRSLVAAALANLLTANWSGDVALIREAEVEAVTALAAVGGPLVPKT